MKKNKDLYGAYLLPECIKLTDIQKRIKDTNSHYNKVNERMRILDGADRGRVWDVIKAKFPHYQLTPDTNWVNYIKDNLVASIYTTGRYGTLSPKSQDDIKFCVEFNAALSTIWDSVRAEYYQLLAGERAALLNLGITMVGWDNKIIGGTANHWYKGDIKFKNIDPMKFRRDPYADEFDNSEFCYYFDDYSLPLIGTKKIYRERIKELKQALGEKLGMYQSDDNIKAETDRKPKDADDNGYHRITYFYQMYEADNEDGYKIAEIHLLDDAYVLYSNNDLKPRMFPFALLYCNLPAGDLVGASEPAKIFGNYVTYDLLNSIYATHAYKAQRPPRFVNTQSGINLRQFAKYGNDADKTFPVNGDARAAVHYAEFPTLPPELLTVHQRIGMDIQQASGIDAMYAGKDTGSIQTTGGMDSLQVATTQRDNTKIALYEQYTKRLTELVVNNLVQFGDKREYTVKDPVTQTVKTISLDFPKVDDDIRFRYDVDIQTYLPRSKARLSMAANMLLEKQAQYKPNPEIITTEEWLLMQDIPFSDLIFKRMGIQRNTRITEQVAQTLEMFADLMDAGIDPNEAVDQIANTLQQEQQPGLLGNVAQAGMPQELPMEAGSVQAAQAGANAQAFGNEMDLM